MLARALVLSSLLVATACGGKAATTTTPAAPTPAPPTPAASTPFELEGVSWTIAVAGDVAPDPEYGLVMTTADFKLELMPWPRSEVFVQTIPEQLEAARKQYPSVEVLHQADHGPYHFELVIAAPGLVDGTVIMPDPDEGDSVLCSFEVPAGSDWRPALAACNSIARARD